MKVSEIKYLAKDANIKEITLKDDSIISYFKGDMDIRAVSSLASLFERKFFVSAGEKPHMVLKTDPRKKEDILEIVKKMLKEYNKVLHTDKF